jgi:hypothetical protein
MTHHSAVPPVVFVRFFPRDRTAALLAAFIFSLAGIPLLIASIATSDWAPLIVGLVIMLIVAACVFLYVLRTRQRNRLKQRLHWIAANRVLRRDIVEALVNLRRLERRFTLIRRFPWNFAQARTALNAHAVSEALCIVDARLRRPLRQLHRIDELLECEQAGESMHQAGSWTMIGVGLSALAAGILLTRVSGGWVCGAMVLFVVAFGLVATAIHRWMVVGRGSLSRMRGIVVGMGFAADHHHVWFASKSLTILRYENGKIHITILDECGRIALVYLSAPMVSFEEFWQRWMHPHPRPELAAEFTAQAAGGN